MEICVTNEKIEAFEVAISIRINVITCWQTSVHWLLSTCFSLASNLLDPFNAHYKREHTLLPPFLIALFTRYKFTFSIIKCEEINVYINCDMFRKQCFSGTFPIWNFVGNLFVDTHIHGDAEATQSEQMDVGIFPAALLYLLKFRSLREPQLQ
jgi:hypothetical protein